MGNLQNQIVPHTYYDSVVLMGVSRTVITAAGVNKAAVMMGTPQNLSALQDAGLLTIPPEQIHADDLVIAIDATTEELAEQAIKTAITSLTPTRSGCQAASIQADHRTHLPRFISWKDAPAGTCFVVISVPGEYAAAEAWKALKAGQHVLIFSNNVPVEEEVALKCEAQRRGRLVLGHECGTAIIGGVPLAFANRVHRGKIGIAAASGSGLQEMTCLIDRLGSGVSQAIGVGGRDLSEQVGGLGMHAALDLLSKDATTELIVLLSKPPAPRVAESILQHAGKSGKPVVACFLGLEPSEVKDGPGLRYTSTIEEAALAALELAGSAFSKTLKTQEHETQPDWQGKPALLRGLYSGGTLAYEAMIVLEKALGHIYSNVPLDKRFKLKQGQGLAQHTCLDLGTEEYTTGVPHPMIDGCLRAELVAQVSEDPLTGVILLDVVLGTGCDQQPVETLAAGVQKAFKAASNRGRPIFIVASVTGTDADPQCYTRQVEKLRTLGVLVAPSNAAAARMAAELLK